jgi:hypothetical protein
LHLTDWSRHGAHRRHPAGKRTRPAANGEAARSERLHEQQQGEREASQSDGDADRHHSADGGGSAREGKHDAGGQRRRRARAQHTVGRHMSFRHHERRAHDNENHTERRHKSMITVCRPCPMGARIHLAVVAIVTSPPSLFTCRPDYADSW